MLRLFAFLCLLVISMTYEIRPIVKDGLPGFSDVTTAPFLKIGEGYYYVETASKKNWFEAYETCRLIGAELITIDTLEEWLLVNQYLRDMNIDGEPYWTSGTDLAIQGQHIWFSNGLNITLDEIWYPGEPNNKGGNENCDHMSFSKDNNPTGMNDNDCNLAYRYICEAPQPKTAAFIVW